MDDAVATAGPGDTTHATTVVETDVEAVITGLLRALLYAVTTEGGTGQATWVASAVASVVCAVVAGFIAGDDAVPTKTGALGTSCEEVLQFQTIVGFGRVTLGLKDRCFVNPFIRHACSGGERRVDGHTGGFGPVDAADVDGEPAVDEYPNVVVTSKGKGRAGAGVILKPKPHFTCEVEVVSGTTVEPAVVQREERAVVKHVREVGRGSSPGKRQRVWNRDADAAVVVPLVEAARTDRSGLRTRGRKYTYGLAVGAPSGFHHARLEVADAALHVRMR